jgi:hypothetical protein
VSMTSECAPSRPSGATQRRHVATIVTRGWLAWVAREMERGQTHKSPVKTHIKSSDLTNESGDYWSSAIRLSAPKQALAEFTQGPGGPQFSGCCPTARQSSMKDVMLSRAIAF